MMDFERFLPSYCMRDGENKLYFIHNLVDITSNTNETKTLVVLNPIIEDEITNQVVVDNMENFVKNGFRFCF